MPNNSRAGYIVSTWCVEVSKIFCLAVMAKESNGNTTYRVKLKGRIHLEILYSEQIINNFHLTLLAAGYWRRAQPGHDAGGPPGQGIFWI